MESANEGLLVVEEHMCMVDLIEKVNLRKDVMEVTELAMYLSRRRDFKGKQQQMQSP